MTVLPIAYLGCVHWFARLCAGGCVIDAHENFVKQSMRTRCDILCADGPTTLAASVVKTPNWPKTPVREVRLDHSKTWLRRHRMSILSAYRSSPYFDHYAGRLEPFLEKKYEFLIDMNMALTVALLDMIGGGVAPVLSDGYVDPAPWVEDLRHSLSEKPRLRRPDPLFREVPYYQPFSPGRFVVGLSIIDLLFAEGPHTLAHLRECVERS